MGQFGLCFSGSRNGVFPPVEFFLRSLPQQF